jgi:uncharacterized protein (TIGR02246 family)
MTTLAPPAADPRAAPAIEACFQHLLQAWARGDADAYAGFFTPDAEYVGFDGSRTVGRDAIARSHRPLFERWLRGTRLVGKVARIQFLGPDVAVVHATGSTIFSGEDRPRPSRDSIQTLVAVREEGRWRFAAFQNTRILRRAPWQWMVYGIASRLLRR